MFIELRLYATLRRYLPDRKAGEWHRLSLGERATVDEALAALGVPTRQELQVFVNDQAVELDHELREGDRVGVFPQVGGGGPDADR
ncbi:MAG: MoaD/ThiS family protein [Chloroflexi bacterium]|nr:MoaD/ThiS family protein [Chloroflexota bacterium]MCL5110010.1 MoaD/ThiS family protein [Chloroflexota bacterium]